MPPLLTAFLTGILAFALILTIIASNLLIIWKTIDFLFSKVDAGTAHIVALSVIALIVVGAIVVGSAKLSEKIFRLTREKIDKII
jgi:hypothetical protein